MVFAMSFYLTTLLDISVFWLCSDFINWNRTDCFRRFENINYIYDLYIPDLGRNLSTLFVERHLLICGFCQEFYFERFTRYFRIWVYVPSYIMYTELSATEETREDGIYWWLKYSGIRTKSNVIISNVSLLRNYWKLAKKNSLTLMKHLG